MDLEIAMWNYTDDESIFTKIFSNNRFVNLINGARISLYEYHLHKINNNLEKYISQLIEYCISNFDNNIDYNDDDLYEYFTSICRFIYTQLEDINNDDDNFNIFISQCCDNKFQLEDIDCIDITNIMCNRLKYSIRINDISGF